MALETFNGFGGEFIGIVKAYDKISREVAVYIPKLMPAISEDDIEKDILTDNGLSDINEVFYDKQTHISNLLWVRAYDTDEPLPEIGSKVLVEFFESDPKLGYWEKFNMNDDYSVIESEKYPSLGEIKIGNKADNLKTIQFNTEDKIEFVLPEHLDITVLTDGKKKTINVIDTLGIREQLQQIILRIGQEGGIEEIRNPDGSVTEREVSPQGILGSISLLGSVIESMQEEIKNLHKLDNPVNFILTKKDGTDNVYIIESIEYKDANSIGEKVAVNVTAANVTQTISEVEFEEGTEITLEKSIPGEYSISVKSLAKPESRYYDSSFTKGKVRDENNNESVIREDYVISLGDFEVYINGSTITWKLNNSSYSKYVKYARIDESSKNIQNDDEPDVIKTYYADNFFEINRPGDYKITLEGVNNFVIDTNSLTITKLNTPTINKIGDSLVFNVESENDIYKVEFNNTGVWEDGGNVIDNTFATDSSDFDIRTVFRGYTTRNEQSDVKIINSEYTDLFFKFEKPNIDLLKSNGDMLIWNNSKNKRCSVIVDTNPYIVTTNNINISEKSEIEVGNHTVNIQYISEEDDNYLDSNVSNTTTFRKIASPIINNENNSITWAKVVDASFYRVFIRYLSEYGFKYELLETIESNLKDQYSFNLLEEGLYTVQACCSGENLLINSTPTPYLTDNVILLDSQDINILVNDNTIEFSYPVIPGVDTKYNLYEKLNDGRYIHRVDLAELFIKNKTENNESIVIPLEKIEEIIGDGEFYLSMSGRSTNNKIVLPSEFYPINIVGGDE